MKQSIITAFLGSTRDRFSDYQQPTELEQRLQLAAQVPGVSGVEVVYPYETGEAEATLALMKKYNLEFAAINANIKKEINWVPGAISRPQEELRKGALEIIRGAKDFAKKVGAPLVTVCPLSDGFDNLFQVDYPKAWRNMVDAIAEAADYLPEIPLFIEYKINETRVNCHLDSCAKSIVLLKDVQNSSTGITIDFGHSLLAKENPAQVLALCEESNIDYYLHTNDNDWNFDWDLIGASRNFLHTVEFFFYAKEYGYNKFFTADASPRIFDMMGFFTQHAKMNQAIWNLVEGLDRAKYRKLMAEERHMDLMELVRTEIYRL
ncbi:sugar phosphate isomerase/epimerase family protein [Marinoscillum furvescens]|uniref:Xylose isomerase n=1 Tax=Marinoscillum furvescens DSM 4134 TaxID=1122208 RepID=A0A3D9L1B4_MARFU|nr:sugar phosphate isomerase/epimerase [Marinoscillum furvescens]RED95665.1 xylose isomerase [Marinoscillum furvescens DSM 4134]